MSQFDPPPYNEFDGPTLDEKLSMPDQDPNWTAGRSHAEEEFKDAFAQLRRSLKPFKKPAIYALVGYVIVKQYRKGKLPKEVILKVTKFEAEAAKIPGVNVWYDTPYGKLFLSGIVPAAPPVEG